VPLREMGANVMTLLLRMIREEPVETVSATWPVSLRLGTSTRALR
jgi:DNA-binding LacI/PurR family transcriptional regulator